MGNESLVINYFVSLKPMKVLQWLYPGILLCSFQWAQAQSAASNMQFNENLVLDSIRNTDLAIKHPPEGVMSVFVTEGTVIKKGMNGVMDTYAEVQATPPQKFQNDLIPAVQTSVFFEINQSSLSDAAIMELKKYLTVLKSSGVKNIYVSAFTDASGSKAYNQQLSVRRAESVKKWLVQQGVSAGVIIANGKGPLEASVDEAPSVQRKAVLQVIIK